MWEPLNNFSAIAPVMGRSKSPTLITQPSKVALLIGQWIRHRSELLPLEKR